MEPHEEVKKICKDTLNRIRESKAATGLIVCAWPDEEKQLMEVFAVGSELLGDEKDQSIVDLADIVHGLQLLSKSRPDQANAILEETWKRIDVALSDLVDAYKKERH